MSRQVNGQGRKPHRWRGRWRAYLTTGYDRDGKPIREYCYGKTEAECQAALDKLRLDFAAGRTDTENITLGDWLEEWLASKKRRIKPRTNDLYQRDIDTLGARIKKIKLKKLTPRDFEREIAGIADEKNSTNAANKVRATVHTALEDAVYQHVLAGNPISRVRTLKHESKAPKVWTGEEVLKFTAYTAQGRPMRTKPGEFEPCEYHALFYTILVTGARIGELIPLTWGDLTINQLHINKTITGTGKSRTVGPPKSRAGNRILGLPEDGVITLQEHRKRLGARATTESSLVFPTSAGTMLESSNAVRALKSWSVLAEVTPLTPHELRHTFASMAIAAGMTPVDLARQLGHSDPSFTLRRYTQFFHRAQVQAVPSLRTLTGAKAATEKPPQKATGGTSGGTATEMVN